MLFPSVSGLHGEEAEQGDINSLLDKDTGSEGESSSEGAHWATAPAKLQRPANMGDIVIFPPQWNCLEIAEKPRRKLHVTYASPSMYF